MNNNDLQPKDFVSLRSIAERLGNVVEGLASKPVEALPAARELLDDLKILLPKRSVAELTEKEFCATLGLLAEISGHANLAMIIGRGEHDGHVRMLWTGSLRLADHRADTVFPRWDLPAPIPEEGIPTSVDRLVFERPVLIDSEQVQDAALLEAAEPEPEIMPAAEPVEQFDEPEEPEEPEEELSPLTFEEFCALPNRSLVTTDVKSTGGKLEGVRTRKGRWRMSDMPDSCSDKEAWEEFTDAAAGNPVNHVVGSHES